MVKEITLRELDTGRFVEEKTAEIAAAVGKSTAISALSGGVDSSTVTMLGHRALGTRLRSVFIENGLMREGELAAEVLREVPAVVSVTYNIPAKPPSTIEAV